MKKNKRVGLLLAELTENPSRLFESRYFCTKFDIARSSLSEDIRLVSEILSGNGSGRIETVQGAGGGIRYIPGISDERIRGLQAELIDKLTDPSRLLGGKYLYTADIMFNGRYVSDMARMFAQCFSPAGADYVVTVETKGIPLASQTAYLLNLPLVVIRREARYSEGSTVSINYFSGSSERIQRMSLSKRAVKPEGRAIVIDDFMRAGGTLRGIEDILGEFSISVAGMGVALESRFPEKKKVRDYKSILIIDEIDEENRVIRISGGKGLLRDAED